MKINNLAILICGILGATASYASTAPKQQKSPFADTEKHHHGVEKRTKKTSKKNAHKKAAPLAEQNLQPQTLSPMYGISTMSVQAAAAPCDLSKLATNNTNALISELKSQGTNCINELFSASATVQKDTYTSANMYQVALHVKTLAEQYQGGGNDDIEALFLYLRAGFYVEFYNDQVSFATWVKPAVKNAIDAFVNNTHFYDNNEGHAKTLSEVIITMDSSEQQDVYLPVVTEWLNRWDQNYAQGWNMRNAVNGVFTILFRGQWNTGFVNNIGNQTQLVSGLQKFVTGEYMIGSEAEFMIANAARELGRLKKYSNTSIQNQVDAALNDVFSRYKMYGYGDAVWLGAADTASYYGDCTQYNICNFEKQLENQVLSQTYVCSSTIKIRSQNMTATQHQAACGKMGYEENYFHNRLQTNNQPVADDVNAQLQVNIFDSSNDYGKYAGAIFGIDTNNGGMYLEGDPAAAGNVPNFVAYEASYANADHFVWNLEHEYVHYLDGRFDLYGGFNAPTEAIVWWTEGVAEYIANENNNQAAIDTIKDGSTYTLGAVFDTTYAGFDQDRIYRWGYLAVRFMFERHMDEVNQMLADTRSGNWAAYKARVNTWATSYDNEFTQWTQALASGTTPPTNKAPIVEINGPYIGNQNQAINFSSQGSYDEETSIASYQWDFGNGDTSNQANPSYSYAQAGDFTVTLTLRDSEGLSASANTNVTVIADTTPPVGDKLSNGVARSISGAQDEELMFQLDVPAGATNLSISLAGGTGDADLYVKFGAAPTKQSFDCRPYIGGNNETCTIDNVQAGTYFIMVHGYNSFDTQITARFDSGEGNSLPDACATSYGLTGGRVTVGEVSCLAEQDPIWLSIADVSNHQSMTIRTANGSGNLSLLYKNGAWPSDSYFDAQSTNSGNNECIYVTNQGQYWGYLKVSGAAQGASILVEFDAAPCN